MKSKFAAAMIVYAVLALIGWFVLTGNIRLFVMILLGGLAVNTCIARAAGW
jgi:hypothetical protein